MIISQHVEVMLVTLAWTVASDVNIIVLDYNLK